MLLEKVRLALDAIVNWLTPQWATPNMVTMLRIFLSPILMYLVYFWQSDHPAVSRYFDREDIIFYICVLGAISDYWDGSLARVRNLQSVWGKKLDVIADKFFLLVLIFLLYDFNKFIFSSTIILQLLTVVISVFAYFEGKKIKVNYFGKAMTALIYLGFCLILFKANYCLTSSIFYISLPLMLINIGLIARDKSIK